MATIKLNKEQVIDIIDDKSTIKNGSEPGKHDVTSNSYVFKHPDGKFYEFWADFSYSDGLQFWGDTIDAVEVRAKEIRAIIWEEV